MSADDVALKHLRHIETMIDDDGVRYDLSQAEADALEFARDQIAKNRDAMLYLRALVRTME